MNQSSRDSDLKKAGQKPGEMADSDFSALEKRFGEGMSVQQIVEAFAEHGAQLSEATFRKYVQLGLLPRSIRVGRKGKHRGSQGLYPASAVRQIHHIRRLMRQGFTMEEIQREFLFVRGELEALTRQLSRVYNALEEAIAQRAEGKPDKEALQSIQKVRELGDELVKRLEFIEQEMRVAARMARAAI